MSKREVAVLACRILSLYALVMGAGTTASALASAFSLSILNAKVLAGPSDNGLPHWLMTGGIGGIGYCGAAVLLWLGADALGAAMARGTDDPHPVTSFDWRPFSIALVGLWTLASSVPQLAGLVTSAVALNVSRDWVEIDIVPRLVPDAVSATVRLAIGLWLLLGAGGIFRALRSLRDVGRDPSVAP
jgi:hypothetical protein